MRNRESVLSHLKRSYTAALAFPRVRKLLVTLPLTRGLVWRFVAGENFATAVDSVKRLNMQGLSATLNFVGTHVNDAAEARSAASHVAASLPAIRRNRLDANASIRLTKIGLDIDENLCIENLHLILRSAQRAGVFVWIDMEESRYFESTLRCFEDAQTHFGPALVGIVLQSYLKRLTMAALDRLIALQSRIRIVKGGYWEPSDVAYRKREQIDERFREHVGRLLMSDVKQPAIATHDAAFFDFATTLAAARATRPEQFEFQLLYGIRPDLAHALARCGYRVRVYVPYGRDWSSYFAGCARRSIEALRPVLERRCCSTKKLHRLI
ncbi:MAG: proline dehydrogenase family protein [Acidobacteriaceae bacterium]|nr:proline dehydrogenase family protein [Acidobacteriaceae bacterium]